MPRIGCAGILVADTFCGPMQALPKAGELLAIDAMVSSAGGCAANVAIDLALQGLEVEIAGCVGNDNAANGFVAELEAFGVGCARIVRCADPVSYTHLDVYKRQAIYCVMEGLSASASAAIAAAPATFVTR